LPSPYRSLHFILLFLSPFLFGRGIIPEDLSFISPFKRILYEDDLIKMAKEFNYEPYLKAVVLSIFFEEQGKGNKIIFWNNNSSGFHPWKKRFPWGWAKRYWIILPEGYTMLKEGKTKKRCPYFSFRFLADCFQIMCVIVYDRGILDYRTYLLRWAGKEWYNSQSVYNFQERIKKFYYLLGQ